MSFSAACRASPAQEVFFTYRVLPDRITTTPWRDQEGEVEELQGLTPSPAGFVGMFAQ